jgi:hypothetical protein
MGKKYSHDMSQESEKQNFSLEEGWHKFEISKVENKLSKAGNDMFVIGLALDSNAGIGTEVYMIAEQGKRWFLKQLLKACDCPASEDGVYEWDEDDIIGKTVEGRVENVQEEWIDRKGNARTTEKSKVVEFRKIQ